MLLPRRGVDGDVLQRYDHNHRGQLQVLMHGVVSKKAFDAGAVEYEILHGNELNGVDPGAWAARRATTRMCWRGSAWDGPRVDDLRSRA